VPRRRVSNRDVLRTIGSLAAGLLGSFGLFLTMLLVAASAILALLATTVAGNQELLWQLYHLDFARNLTEFTQSSMESWGQVLRIGMLFGLAVMVLGDQVARRVPQQWFERDGDAVPETLQERILWITGVLALGAAFTLPPCFIRGLGFLAPAAFLAGGTLVALLGVLVLSLTRDFIELENLPIASSRSVRSHCSAVLGLFLSLTVVAGILALLPWMAFTWLTRGGISLNQTGAAGLLSAMLAGGLAWGRKFKAADLRARLSSVAGKFRRMGLALQRAILALAVAVALVTALVLALILASFAVQRLVSGTIGAWDFWLVFLAASFALVVLGYSFDFNHLSLHHFYRDRLAEAYLRTTGPKTAGDARLEAKRDNSEMTLTDLHGSVDPVDRSALAPGAPCITVRRFRLPSFLIALETLARKLTIPGLVAMDRLMRIMIRVLPMALSNAWHDRLFQLPRQEQMIAAAATSAPYHLFCACLNLTSERNPALRTRKSDGFIFSKLYCGSDTTGYLNSGYYRDNGTTVAQALTISGAATDSAIGRDTFFAQSVAASVCNVRLGQWLENPGFRGGRLAQNRENLVFWPKYLLMEALGLSDARQRLVHLSDGGHTGDNLGILPLLKRRCALILAVDAEADPAYEFVALTHALRYAQVDGHARIQIDLEALTPDPQTGLAITNVAVGEISYQDEANRTVAKGVLIVLKSAVTHQMPLLIRQYRLRYPAFPQEPTLDQFFSEDQFEAYRLLGQGMADALLTMMPSLERGIVSPAALVAEYRQWVSRCRHERVLRQS
jgi:hypothetical protein